MSYLTEAEKDFNAILGEEIDMDSFFIFQATFSTSSFYFIKRLLHGQLWY